MLDLWKFSHLDTRFYRHVGQFASRQITVYIVSFYLLLSVGLTTLFAFRTWPVLIQKVQLTWESLYQQWPDNTIVRLENNQLHLEKQSENALIVSEEKIEIFWPKEVIDNTRLPQLFFVIDPLAQHEQAAQYPSWLIATPDLFFVKTSTGELNSIPWNELFPDQEIAISKESIREQQLQFMNNQRTALFSFLPLSFIWFSFARLLTRLLVLLLMTWFAQPVLSMFGWIIDYRKTYRVGLFLLPLSEEVSFLLKLLYPQNQNFSFWLIWTFALLTIGWTNRRLMMMAKK